MASIAHSSSSDLKTSKDARRLERERLRQEYRYKYAEYERQLAEYNEWREQEAIQNKRDQWRAASARYYERHPEVKEKKRLKAAEKRAAKKLARRRWDPPKKTGCTRLSPQELGSRHSISSVAFSQVGGYPELGFLQTRHHRHRLSYEKIGAPRTFSRFCSGPRVLAARGNMIPFSHTHPHLPPGQHDKAFREEEQLGAFAHHDIDINLSPDGLGGFLMDDFTDKRVAFHCARTTRKINNGLRPSYGIVTDPQFAPQTAAAELVLSLAAHSQLHRRLRSESEEDPTGRPKRVSKSEAKKNKIRQSEDAMDDDETSTQLRPQPPPATKVNGLLRLYKCSSLLPSRIVVVLVHALNPCAIRNIRVGIIAIDSMERCKRAQVACKSPVR
ncbi:hypothetical protein B0H14DRAFT_2585280 [Mycena olivaceomarginata]|nr:hypothetical protein B0H14DRAFT_2585280 [Mycena olivaceomarginata]